MIFTITKNKALPRKRDILLNELEQEHIVEIYMRPDLIVRLILKE